MAEALAAHGAASSTLIATLMLAIRRASGWSRIEATAMIPE